MDQKSTSGNIKMFNNPIYGSSKKQRIVALSSLEAEYISLAEGMKEVISLRGVLNDFNIDYQSIVVYEDNTGVKSLTHNPSSARTKHIDDRYNFIKDEVLYHRLVIHYRGKKKIKLWMLTQGLPIKPFLMTDSVYGWKSRVKPKFCRIRG